MAALAVSASGLGLVSTAGSTVDYPILKVKKVVAGTATEGFTVTVACNLAPGDVTAQNPQPPEATLTFNPDGTPDTTDNVNWQSVAGNWQFQNSNLIGAVCTVTETGTGGAVSASYACAFFIGQAGTDVSQHAGTEGCSGPASGPTVVTFSEIATCAGTSCWPDSSALVTITNAFPVITVGPSASVPGGTVTISGTECALLDEAAPPTEVSPTALGGIVTGTVAFTPPLPFGPVTAASDGTWSTTIVVPAGTPPGSYAVNATCADPPGVNQVTAQATGFAYETKFLTIAIPATPRFTG